MDQAQAVKVLHGHGFNDEQIEQMVAKYRAKAGTKAETETVRRPLTMGNVIIAVLVGNILTAVICTIGYLLLR